MAKLQSEIIAHQSSIDAMLDRLKKSEDNIAKGKIYFISSFQNNKNNKALHRTNINK